MKQAVKTKLHEGTLGGDELRMGIHQDAVGHITGVLTKMYANPLLACIREYSTNAWDSHVEAGTDQPIEVELPTSNEPRLRIRDWGVGLDELGIREIYSQYGASTKRNTNAQNGMLGIGCKSALAYTDQFTVTAVKDGTMTQVLVSYDEDGAGKMTLLGNKPVGIPDGVEVSIPIKAQDIDRCRELAQDFYKFWPSEHVLIDGQAPPGFSELEGIWLDEHTILTKQVSEDLVVMGKVAYPLVDGEKPLFPQRSYRDSHHAVCMVPIGAVSFAPSRESLMDSKRTKEALEKLRQKVAALRDKACEEQIANAPSAAEAQDALIECMELGYQGTALWQGREVVLTLTREGPVKPDSTGYVPPFYPHDASVDVAVKHSYLHLTNGYRHRKSGERTLKVDLRGKKYLVFTGFEGKNFTNVKRAKLDQWWSKQPEAAKTKNAYGDDITPPMPHVIAVGKLTPDERFWLDGQMIRDWADVEAEVLPKTTTADGSVKRIAGSYDAYVQGNYVDGIEANKIAAMTVPVYWTQGNRWTMGHANEVRDGAIPFKSCVIVCLPGNRIEKFKRDFPQAKNLREAAQEAALAWAKTQDKEDAKAYWIQQECRVGNLKKIDPARLDDPDLKALVKIANRDTTKFQQGRSSWSRYLTTDDRHTKDVQWAEAVLDKYPLWDGFRYGIPNLDHMILYLNAAYIAAERS